MHDMEAECVRIMNWNKCEKTDTGIILECTTDEGTAAYAEIAFVFTDVFKFSLRKARLPEQKREKLRECMLSMKNLHDVRFTVDETDSLVAIGTESIHIQIHRMPFQIIVRDRNGTRIFSQSIEDLNVGGIPESPALCFKKNIESVGGFSVCDSYTTGIDECFYGFGEIFSPLDKRGQLIDSWNCDASGTSFDRSYKNIPFFISSKGYGLFLYSTARIKYNMSAHSQEAYTVEVFEDEIQWFFIYGPEPGKILERYSDITGYAPLPPKFSFGLWMSRFGYKNRKELEDICKKLRGHNIPCDVVHLDPYWLGDEDKWCQLEWDYEKFPSPNEMVDMLNENGFQLCLWENPYIPDKCGMFEEGVQKGFLVKDLQNNTYISPHWAETQEKSGLKQAYVDFTNDNAVDWYGERHRKILQSGVRAFKTDFGEAAPSDGIYECNVDGRLVHNIYPLLYNRTVFGSLNEKYPGEALVWARSAYAGSQRYPVHWGGDSKATYGNMAAQLRGLLSLGMSGIPFSGHDIGGFSGDSIGQPDLYIRWAQFGLFSSHSRCHGMSPREPWEYGKDAEEIFREMVELRYKLLPYIYSEAYVSTKTGLPIVRPMVLEFQKDETMKKVDLQYMFGSSLLVAPVFNKEGNTTTLLPAGKWYDFWSDRVLTGPMQIEEKYPMNRFPLFVREGAIIPMMRDKVQYIGSRSWGPLEIHIYAGRDNEFTLIDKLDGKVTMMNIRHHKTGMEEVIGAGKHDEILLKYHNGEKTISYDIEPGDGFYIKL